MKGVDISYAPLNAARCAALKADGVQVLHQCLWTGAEAPGVAGTNLLMAQAEGFLTAGYISVTGYMSGTTHVLSGYNSIPRQAWARLIDCPIDVELPGIPNATIDQALGEVEGLGKREVIYTSPHLWRTFQQDTCQFSRRGVLLWLADWDGIENTVLKDPFGGWTQELVLGKQYRGGSDQPWGFDTDLDEWNEELLIGMGMTPDEAARMKALEDALNVETFAEMAGGDIRRRDVAMLKQRIAFIEALAGSK